MGKLCSILLQTGPGGGGSGTMVRAPLTLAMAIVDDTGAEAGTLGQLLQGLKTLTSKNTLLHKRLECLSANILAQGGVTLNGLGLTLEAQALGWCNDSTGMHLRYSSMSCRCSATSRRTCH
jgi:hypothetical protein